MPKNLRGNGKRLTVKYTLAVESGDVVLQDGFHGVAMTKEASGGIGVLNIDPGEVEVTISSGQTWPKGTLIYLVGSATPNALTSTAGGRLVGKVSRVYGTSDEQKGVSANTKVWMLMLPNNV